MKPDDRLEVERLGGLAGLGGTRSRLRSRGELSGTELTAAERQRIGQLFAAAPPGADPGADGFRYRLRLHRAGAAAPDVLELPESAVPQALSACVRDELV